MPIRQQKTLKVTQCKAPSRFHQRRFYLVKLSLITSFVLFFQGAGYAFDLGSALEDMGTAVKEGYNSLEKTLHEATEPEDSGKKTKQVEQKKAAVNPKTAKYKGKTAGTMTGNTSGSLFSSEPINPLSPPQGVSSFKAGDRIYGMLKAAKPWKELNKNSSYIIIWLTLDGKQKAYKSIGLKRGELLERDYFIIDIAPDPGKMTNYTDRDIVFPEKDGHKFGPELFTKYLSELSPGEHTFRLEVKAYNKIFAAGEFSISGDDFSVYAALLEDIKAGAGSKQMMPKIGMTDVSLQDQMKALLKNSGWPKIERLVVVDKDWWLDRVSGGDSPLKSRHIEAAAAAKDSDGSYYFSHVTFHQPMLITGDWGKLELTRTEKKKPILKENINK